MILRKIQASTLQRLITTIAAGVVGLLVWPAAYWGQKVAHPLLSQIGAGIGQEKLWLTLIVVFLYLGLSVALNIYLLLRVFRKKPHNAPKFKKEEISVEQRAILQAFKDSDSSALLEQQIINFTGLSTLQAKSAIESLCGLRLMSMTRSDPWGGNVYSLTAPGLNLVAKNILQQATAPDGRCSGGSR